MRAATRAGAPNDPVYYANYQYFWWLDPDRPGRFYAPGKYGQYIYVAPDADTVVVRFGRSSGVTSTTFWRPFATSRTSSRVRSDRDVQPRT